MDDNSMSETSSVVLIAVGSAVAVFVISYGVQKVSSRIKNRLKARKARKLAVVPSA